MHWRLLTLPLAFLLVATTALAAPSDGFGSAGAPSWDVLAAPTDLVSADEAGEPTIGIPWETGHVFYQAFGHTYRIAFDGGGNATWDLVTPETFVKNGVPNADPMLHADPQTGRVWAGGLLTVCSLMFYTDDDAENWDPSGNMCGIYGVDHQTIGSGPWAGSPPPGADYDRALYYCAHGEAINSPFIDPATATASPTACVTSLDGGVTWLDPVPWVGGCGSLHGHVRVSPVTGFAAVPDADCATDATGSEKRAGFAYSDDNGVTWMSRYHPDAPASLPFNNPSLAFGHDEGWLWYGQANSAGAFIGLSKDQGLTWEAIGGGSNATTTWLDVGRLYENPIVYAIFPDVQVGDDDRIAFSFLGVEDPDAEGLPGPHQCTDRQEDLVWHYYIAMSYDAGENWRVQRMTADPVQIGGIWQGQGSDCRNLLDFNDMDIDAEGRVHIAFADGCIANCTRQGSNATEGWRTQYATLIRQASGNGLFAAYDLGNPAVDVSDEGGPAPGVTDTWSPGVQDPVPDNSTQTGSQSSTDRGRGIPGVGPFVLGSALLGVALLARRS